MSKSFIYVADREYVAATLKAGVDNAYPGAKCGKCGASLDIQDPQGGLKHSDLLTALVTWLSKHDCCVVEEDE